MMPVRKKNLLSLSRFWTYRVLSLLGGKRLNRYNRTKRGGNSSSILVGEKNLRISRDDEKRSHHVRKARAIYFAEGFGSTGRGEVPLPD